MRKRDGTKHNGCAELERNGQKVGNMCEYCELEKIEDVDGKFINKIVSGRNKPLFEERNGCVVQISLSGNGKYILTNGYGGIEISCCPICGRGLKDV